MKNEIKALIREIPRWVYWYPFRYYIQYLPRKTSYLCAKNIGLLSYFLQSKARYDIGKGLKLFLNSKTDREICKIVKNTFEEKAFSAIDTFYYPKLTKDNIDCIVQYNGLEHIDDARKLGKGVILMHGHFCNEEFLMPAMGHKGYPMNQIGSRWEPPPAKGWIPNLIRKKAFQLRIGYREKFPVVFHYIDKSLRSAYRCLENNEVLLVAADGREGTKWHHVQFLGRTYSFSPGVFQIARRTGSTVLPTFLIREGNYYTFKIFVEKPFQVVDDDTINIRNFIQILESYIKNYPWFYAKVFWLKDSIKKE